VLLMSFTEESIVAGVATFVFYGLGARAGRSHARDAGTRQSLRSEAGEVGPPFAGSCAGSKHSCRAGIRRDERGQHFVADFEGRGTDAGSQPREQLGVRPLRTHRRDRVFEYARR
jgi:hypothetical protein